MNLVAFSGKKQSGKDTSVKFIYGEILKKKDIIFDYNIDDDGDLWVPIEKEKEEDEQKYGVLDVTNVFNKNIQDYLYEVVGLEVRNIGFADTLKILCAELFNLQPDLLNGTEEQKNMTTEYLYRQMPLFNTDDLLDKKIRDNVSEENYKKNLSIREFLQCFAEIFRKIYPDVWVNSVKKQLQLCASDLVFIRDLRYENEFNMVKELGGKVIRFTRSISKDKHSSERDLDLPFDAIIDNQKMTIHEKNQKVKEVLVNWNVI